jgi:hypothetical protein
VQRCIDVTPADALDEGTDDVVVLVAITVVTHRDTLNCLLHIGDLDDALDTRDGFESSQSAASVTRTNAYKMVHRGITHGGSTSKAARIV